jgi:hypothetical protein
MAIVLVLIAAVLLSGCASATEMPVEQAPAADEESMTVVETLAVEVAVEQAESAPAIQATAGPSGELSLLSLQPPGGRMVIKDAIMDLLVDDTARAIDEVTELAAVQGGYLLASRSWYVQDDLHASIKMAVPSANFERTLTNLRALGVRVINESASGQDVSAEYNDLELRLSNLEATAARVRTFLDDAKTVEETLRVNQELTRLEGEIEQIKGQMKFYEGRAAFSTIDVSLTPLVPTPTVTPTLTPTPTPTPEIWNPGQSVQGAMKMGTSLWQGLVDAAIFVCVGLWPLIILVALVGGVVWLVLRRQRIKRARADQAAAAAAAQPLASQAGSQETPQAKQ